MKKYKIPVTWQMSGEVEIVSKSLFSAVHELDRILDNEVLEDVKVNYPVKTTPVRGSMEIAYDEAQDTYGEDI